MIASSPLAIAESHEGGLLAKIHAFVETSRSAASGGLTWSEFGELMVALLRLVVTVLDTVSAMTGPEKKALALDAVASLFDAVADHAVPMWLYPFWILARPAVRSLVLAIAGGTIESILPLIRGL